MRCHPVILFLLMLFAGCQGGSIAGFWNNHSIDYSDIDAARDQFVAYAEKAVAAPEPEALSSLDVLFDKLHEDEVAYYIYIGWMDAAFYHLLSPCRNNALYAKAVDRMTTDGILSESEWEPYLRKQTWMQYNREGDPATIPGVTLDGRRTLVLVLDLGCPSCKEALTTLAAQPEWAGVRRVAVGCGYGPEPGVPGWDYYFPDNATEIFDPQMTPVWFVVSGDGTVETPYTLVL